MVDNNSCRVNFIPLLQRELTKFHTECFACLTVWCKKSCREVPQYNQSKSSENMVTKILGKTWTHLITQNRLSAWRNSLRPSSFIMTEISARRSSSSSLINSRNRRRLDVFIRRERVPLTVQGVNAFENKVICTVEYRQMKTIQGLFFHDIAM